jgi:hypothetical protein
LLANGDALVTTIIPSHVATAGLLEPAEFNVFLLIIAAVAVFAGIALGTEKTYRHFTQRILFLYGVKERGRREAVPGSINHLLLVWLKGWSGGKGRTE